MSKNKPKEMEVTPQELQKALSKATVEKVAKPERLILIKTDGNTFSVELTGVGNLELKEVCREILTQLGG